MYSFMWTLSYIFIISGIYCGFLTLFVYPLLLFMLIYYITHNRNTSKLLVMHTMRVHMYSDIE